MADNSVLVSTFLKSICSYQLWTLFLTSRSDRIWKKLWSPEKGTARATEDRSCEMGWDTHILSGPLLSLTCQVGVKVGWPQRGPPALSHTQTNMYVTRTGKNQSTFSNGTLVPISEIILLIRITERWTWLWKWRPDDRSTKCLVSEGLCHPPAQNKGMNPLVSTVLSSSRTLWVWY